VVAADDLELFAAKSADAAGDWLAQDIDMTVARRSRGMTFVHAGVFGRGPGRLGFGPLLSAGVRRVPPRSPAIPHG